ncbi:MAG TPA: hypothetical protein VGD58_07290 [Herpetosiphonaceae bacterium]
MNRRWFFALWAVLALALLPVAAQAQTPPPPAVLRLAGNTPGFVYAGTVCGAFEPGQFGAGWVKIPGLDEQIVDLALLKDNVLVTISGSGKVYRRGAGEAWQQVIPEISSARAVAANLTGDRVYLLVGNTSYAVFRSDDAGRTWQILTSTTAEVAPFDIAVSGNTTAGQDIVLFDYGLSGRAGGGSVLSRSVDSGATWSDVPTSADPGARLRLGRIFVDQTTLNFYITGSRLNDVLNRLYRLAPTGNTLTEIGLPADLQIGGVSALTTYPGTMVMAGPRGVFVGPIDGAPNSFRRYELGLNGAEVYDLITTFGRTAGTALYAGTSRGIFTGNPSAVDNWFDASAGFPACPSTGPSPFDRIAPFPDSPQHRYFPETGHSLHFGFKAFWEGNGGLPVFGFPLSEEFVERNADLRQDFTTQYFERERFEYHPENQPPYQVLLGRLGDELLRAQGREWRNEGGNNNPFPNTACQTFGVGGQQRTVCGPFLQYWRTHGLEFDGRAGVSFNESLALFGLPLTAPKVEKNPDGGEVITQWFERARFEYHPGNPDPYKVLLGRLGSESLKGRGIQVP